MSRRRPTTTCDCALPAGPRPFALGGRALLATLSMVVALSGASCPQFVQRYTQPLPRVLPAAPTLRQMIDVVNGNSARIQSFSANRGAISIAGFPALRANIAFLRDKNFRLRGETALTGSEVDLGSNPDEFWFWIRRAQPAALYFCRHDRYATSNARQIIPVDPNWLIEALGVVTFDPTWQHIGPASVGSGRVEIRSTQPTSAALEPVTRILIIDETRATVLEEHLYDHRGERIASAKLSKHRHDPASGATMPREVEIDWPAAQFKITLSMDDLVINQINGDPRQLFTRPQYPSYRDIDLAGPGIEPAISPPLGNPPAAANPSGANPSGWVAGQGRGAAAGAAPVYGNAPGAGAGQGWSSPAGASSQPGWGRPPGNSVPLPPGATPLAPTYQPAGSGTARLPTYGTPPPGR